MGRSQADASEKPIHAIKEDWEAVRERYTRWWANEPCDRALVHVTAPKRGVHCGEWPGGRVNPKTVWADADYMIWRTLEGIRTTYYGGEALPVFWNGWSVGHATLLGCEPQFAADTVWTDPLPDGADGYPPIRFQREGRAWNWMRDSTQRAAHASQGRFFVLPMWGNHAGDNLALIRGNERLMIDIAENPTWVRQAAREVSDILMEALAVLRALADETIVGIEGSINYCCTWSPARTMGFDTDISCMLSPKQFEDLFLPPLVDTMHMADHRIYHLDGTVALQHLDLLLSVPEIHAIQWVPGAGRERILQWIPLIRRIQRAGKSLLVYAHAQDIAALLGEVSSHGLCISTGCASEQEARDLIEMVERLSRPRKPA